MTISLTESEIARFHETGFLHIPDFFDSEREIEPLRRQIHDIIGIVLRNYGLPDRSRHYAPETFDDGYAELIAHDRKAGGVVYDALKCLPGLFRLIGSPDNARVVSQLFDSNCVGVADRSNGMRIDFPGEDQLLTDWHQEYMKNFRSPEGCVIWTPLRRIDMTTGPVQLCVGSHKDGIMPVHAPPEDGDRRSGAYGKKFSIAGRETLKARFKVVQIESKPGDAFFIHFLNVHRSAPNLSDRARWSIQMRLFNFEDRTGQKINWCGGLNAGIRPQDVDPKYVVPQEEPQK